MFKSLPESFPHAKNGINMNSLAVETVPILFIPQQGAASYLCTVAGNQLRLRIIHLYPPQSSGGKTES